MGAFDVAFLHHLHDIEDDLLGDEGRNLDGAKQCLMREVSTNNQTDTVL